MANQHGINNRPSDLSAFAFAVWRVSATFLEFDDFYDYYSQDLRTLFFNVDVDLPLAIEQGQSEAFAKNAKKRGLN